MNNNNRIVKYQEPFHLVIKLTGKPKDNSPALSKPVEEKPKEHPFKASFTGFHKAITERKLEVGTCSITNNLVKISFVDYKKSNHELDLDPITKRLVECFEKNLDQIAEMNLNIAKYDTKLEIEMSDKLAIFSMFFENVKEILLGTLWDQTSFHWSKKNGLLTALTVQGPNVKGTQNCDDYVEFIKTGLKRAEYDTQHVEITRNKCSIKLEKISPESEIKKSRN